MAIATAVSGRVGDLASPVSTSQAESVTSTGSAGYLKPPVIVSTVPGILARHQAEAQAMATPDFSQASAEAAAAATPEPAPQQASFVYLIQPGDTIDSIAAAFGLNPTYILWNNPGVSSDPDLLLVGETLVIPSTNGILYSVTLGDTLSGIAAAYGVPMEDIISYAPNGLASPDSVIEGMVLLLPLAIPPAPPEPIYVAEEPAPEPAGAPIAAAAPVPDPIPEPSYGFIWPFYANISTYYGEGGHRGLDIDGFGSYGAPIAAAGTGVVVLASWSDWGYGYHVVIDHGDGTQTLYAHLSEIWVSQGQYVGQGEAIGALGSTGYSTGPHLHFEVHVGGVAVDPLAYLP
jgi:murein DD-endopeptidase MepM/ murein hydrolase activator NlpD